MIEFLLSLILALTGLAHTVDPGLTAIAQRRAVEVSTDATFNHVGMDPCCYEILAWNSGYADPVTVVMDQWKRSSTHWAILTNPNLTHIGCAHATGQETRDVFACVFRAAEPVEVVSSPKPVPVGSIPTSGANATTAPVRPQTRTEPVLLPDTSMGQEGFDADEDR